MSGELLKGVFDQCNKGICQQLALSDVGEISFGNCRTLLQHLRMMMPIRRD